MVCNHAPGKGYGVFATRDIPRGTVICRRLSIPALASKLGVSVDDLSALPSKLANRYLRNDLLCINHSCAPNCAISEVDDYHVWRTTEHIRRGEEMTKTYVHSVDFGFKTCKDRQSEIDHTPPWIFRCKCTICGSSESNRLESDKRRKEMALTKALVANAPDESLSLADRYKLTTRIISHAVAERVPGGVLRWWSVTPSRLPSSDRC